MEANICDVNHLDGDALLPPRKRLLAGLKRQNSNGPSCLLPLASISTELDSRLNDLKSSHLNDTNTSLEERAEVFRSVALAKAEAAETARAAAEEKAAIAAKAVAAAKSALEFVASVSEDIACKDRYLKKNKLKKHVPVQLLYKKHQPVENCKADEELARKLHRDMNSSPRISKNSSSSDWKSHKHKKIKSSHMVEKTRVSNGGIVLEGYPHSTCNGNTVSGEVNSEGSSREVYTTKVDEKTSKFSKADQTEVDSGETGLSHSKEKFRGALDDTYTTGRKKGRIKLKKLPLSFCAFRDQASPNEQKSKNFPLTEETRGKANGAGMPLFSVDPSVDGMMSVEGASTWKCQDFKATQCVKQNKIMQS